MNNLFKIVNLFQHLIDIFFFIFLRSDYINAKNLII